MNGTTSISIEVDRFRVVRADTFELPCFRLVTEDELQPGEDPEPVVLDVEVECYGYFTPGRYTAAPEDCYPDEGDFEIQDVWVHPSFQHMGFTLTSREEEEVEERFADRMKDPGDY